jgi:Protein of unknown function (DUF664)
MTAYTETSQLLTALEVHREHVLGILEGLDEEALRRPVLPSGWSCLGMVRHLTVSDEQFWFRGVVAGDPSMLTTASEDYAAVWRPDPAQPAKAVFAAYRREAERSNAIITGAALDAEPGYWPEGVFGSWRLPNVRAVVLHVITETATHAGHLDAVRELIDGRQWLPS